MSKPDHSNDQPAQPKRTFFRRFDDFAMRFYGPAARSPRNLRGQDRPSEQTRQWYQNLQQDYVMDKDASGRTYLRPRRPEDGPAAPPNPR
ncbi:MULTISPECIES: hypothetical protein [Kocuria]|jgi:hypothetical protein|uniref:hypothetical protein n=1 Tax=Kocuria TaxID=57493 RepID=UPI00203AF499|nr:MULTISPECIES: hypothetical protein [Kocuria]MCM3689451.1 hypothetical protein [Kocuria rosea]HST72270.1 hypothetical protein [Kocuria rosea]